LDGSASVDPEGGVLAYQWETAEDNPSQYLPAPGALFTFVAAAPGVYRFYLRVSDDQNQSRPDSVAVTVSGQVNRPPVAYAGPDLVFAQADLIPLDAGGSSDPDGDALSYHWEVVSSPVPVSVADSTARQTSFAATVEGEYRVRLVVDDGRAQGSDEVRIRVEAGANVRPVADAGPDQPAVVGVSVTLDGSASTDPDGDSSRLTYRWSVGRTPGAVVLLSDSTAVRPSFTPAEPGEYKLALVVDDGLDRSFQDLVIITVAAQVFPEQGGMIEVPAGPFSMGSELGFDEERPVHRVELSAYWIDKYEVSTDGYQQCVADGKCTAAAQGVGCNAGRTDRQDHPANCITWAQADAYCRWAAKRLPSEAEWEKAARGTDGRRFAWGDESPNPSLLNYERRYTTLDPKGSTAPVGTFPDGVSYYGLYHMGGNVAEWVADYYQADYYAHSPLQDPPGPATGLNRVGRGGTWAIGLDDRVVTATVRHQFTPSTSDNTVGVRCARSSPP
jgi:formylglycine-generating enzyme required for sulfatase activity